MSNEHWVPELRAIVEKRKREEQRIANGSNRLLYFLVGTVGMAIALWSYWAGRGEAGALSMQSRLVTFLFGVPSALVLLAAFGVLSMGSPESTSKALQKIRFRGSSYDGDGGSSFDDRE